MHLNMWHVPMRLLSRGKTAFSVFAHNFKAACSTTLKQIQIILSSAVNISTVLVHTYCFSEGRPKTSENCGLVNYWSTTGLKRPEKQNKNNKTTQQNITKMTDNQTCSSLTIMKESSLSRPVKPNEPTACWSFFRISRFITSCFVLLSYHAPIWSI